MAAVAQMAVFTVGYVLYHFSRKRLDQEAENQSVGKTPLIYSIKYGKNTFEKLPLLAGAPGSRWASAAPPVAEE